MKSKYRWFPAAVLILVVVVVVGFFINTSVSLMGASKAQKMVMPGKYQLYLPKDEYTIWYFWEWPSKSMHEKEGEVDIKIEDSKSAPISKISESEQGDAQLFGNNRGRFLMMIRIKENGQFFVSSLNRCVLVVVPSRAFLPDQPKPSFMGATDDLGFCEGRDKHVNAH